MLGIVADIERGIRIHVGFILGLANDGGGLGGRLWRRPRPRRRPGVRAAPGGAATGWGPWPIPVPARVRKRRGGSGHGGFLGGVWRRKVGAARGVGGVQRGVEQLRQVGKLLAKMTGVVDEGADGLGIRYLGGLLRIRRELGWRPTLGHCRFRLRPQLGLDAAGLCDGFVFRRLGLVDGSAGPSEASSASSAARTSGAASSKRASWTSGGTSAQGSSPSRAGP